MKLHASCAMLAALLAASALRADDQVYDLEGRVMATGTVTATSANEVVISSRTGDRNIPSNQIQRIIYEEDTGETRTIKTRVQGGQIEQALKDFDKVNLAAIQRPELLADLEYYRAYCLAQLALQGSGDKNEAGAALAKFINTQTRSYHLYNASRLMGDVAQAANRHDTAARYYGYLARSPWPGLQMEGAVLTASSLVSAGKFEEAAAKFDEVLAKPNDDPESLRQKKFAEIGKAYCLGKGGQSAEAIGIVNKIIKEENNQDGALFGRAYNALGVSHLAAGNKKEALRAFLHTSLMFTADPNVHAESLYHLAKLWEDLDESERALKTRALLKSRYASTSWANK